MRWLPLDLDNFTNISQEVDDVVSKYKELALDVAANPNDRGAEEALAQLKYSVEQRVDDLENFYYENDMDERAILFEKQRLKLRKVINTNVQKLEAEYGSLEEPSQSRRGPASSMTSSRRPMSASRSKAAGPAQLVHSAAGKKTRVAPIYEWEVRSTKQSPAAAVENSADPRAFEFQVRLSPEEYEELMERRADAGARGRTFLHKGSGKTMSTVRKKAIEDTQDDSPYVTSSGPYIEPSYFENWRTTNKSKWVAKTDFNTAAVLEKQGDAEFLQDGPYIENAFKACLRGDDKSKWVGDNFKRNV